MPNSPAAPKRIFQDLSVKVAICKHAALNPTMLPGRLAEWANVTFGLQSSVNRCTVYKILKKKDVYLALPEDNLAKKNLPSALLLRLDAAMAANVRTVVIDNSGALLSSQLCKWAKQTMVDWGIDASKIDKFSRAWATRFQGRVAMGQHKLHGEAGSVCMVDVAKGRADTKELSRCYPAKDVFNFDESSFYYRRLPKHTIAPNGTVLRGKKQDKTRVTMAVATNATGCERLPLLIVGTANMPVPFRSEKHRIHWVGDKTRQPENPLFHYAYSKKAWMNGNIFRAWLRELDERMRNSSRRILLLVDNVSCHKVGDIGLTHVALDFLPENTTSVLQPMDQGIIKATKDGVYNKRDDRVLSYYYKEEYAIPKVDLFTACVWCADAFTDLKQTVITNAWRKADILFDRSSREFLWT